MFAADLDALRDTAVAVATRLGPGVWEISDSRRQERKESKEENSWISSTCFWHSAWRTKGYLPLHCWSIWAEGNTAGGLRNGRGSIFRPKTVQACQEKGSSRARLDWGKWSKWVLRTARPHFRVSRRRQALNATDFAVSSRGRVSRPTFTSDLLLDLPLPNLSVVPVYPLLGYLFGGPQPQTTTAHT